MSLVREVDKGWNRIAKMLKAAAQAKSYVKVGFVGPRADAPHDSGTASNLEIALFNELGTRTIPARPFIGPSFDKNRKKYEAELATNVAKTFSGTMTMERLLGIIGAQAAADVKAFVTQGEHVPPPNAASTVAAKGSDRPLVDTGRMIGAVSWEVVMKTAGVEHE